jgi:uncharacterized protein (TIGR03083 family)
MTLPIVDQQVACDAGAAATRAYTQLLRSVTDPAPIAVGEWTVGDTATHTAHAFETYAAAVESGSFPIGSTQSLNDHWAGELRKDSQRNPAAAADRIDAAAQTVWAGYRSKPPDQPLEWYGGLKVPAFTPPCILITEAVVHGWDIAHAAGKPWPIDPGVARAGVQGLFPLLPEYVDRDAARGVRICFELRLRGGAPAYLTFEDGVLSVDDAPPRPVDCRLSVDPATYLLVGYGRIAQWGPILKGKVLAWGRKPWLSLKLGKLIANP